MNRSRNSTSLFCIKELLFVNILILKIYLYRRFSYIYYLPVLKACHTGASTKGGPKTPVKPSAQKGAAKTAPPKQAAAAAVKTPQGKKKKGHKHQQYELIVTINLVSFK